jgi:hypothetical protein
MGETLQPLALAAMLIGVTTSSATGEPRPSCATSIAAMTTTAACAGGDPKLHLSWVDVSGMPAGLLAAAIAEAQRLLEPAGIRVRARNERAGTPVQACSIVVVFARDRKGDGSDRLWGAAPAGADNAVWVYPQRVASALGLDPAVPHAWSAGGDLSVRRLLGVVVAHELLHRLAGAPHAPEGLMAPTLSRWDAAFELRVEAVLHAPLRDGVARFSAGLPLPALNLH